MKSFALRAGRAAILAMVIAASALAQMPYQHPLTPPEAKRHNYEHPRPVRRAGKSAPAKPQAVKHGRKLAAGARSKRRAR